MNNYQKEITKELILIDQETENIKGGELDKYKILLSERWRYFMETTRLYFELYEKITGGKS